MNTILLKQIYCQAAKLHKFTITELCTSIKDLDGSIDEKLEIIDKCLSSSYVKQVFDIYYFE